MQRSQLRKFFSLNSLVSPTNDFFLNAYKMMSRRCVSTWRIPQKNTCLLLKQTKNRCNQNRQINEGTKHTNRQTDKVTIQTKRRRNQERQSNAIWLTNELKNLTRQDDEGEYWKLQGRIHSSTKLQHLSSDSIELN